MKKVLLSAAAILAAFGSYAQCDNVNVDATGFFEDFSSEEQITNGDMGLYFWDDKEDVNGFTVASTRAGDSKYGLTVTQAFNSFEPTGVGFGDDNGAEPGGVLNTIDLTGDATFTIDVVNTGDSSIKFRLALQDADGGELDSYAAASAGAFGDAWKHSIEVVLAAGASKTLSGTFAGGVKADYGFDNGDGTYGAFVDGFNFAKVTAVMITVVNSNQNATYQTLALDAQTVEVTNFKVGACPIAVGLSSAANNVTYDVYPNPATEKVQFSKELTNVTVFDAIGNVIETSSKSSNLNVSSYNTGLYFIKSAEGTTQFMVK